MGVWACSFGEIVDDCVLVFSDYPCPKSVHLEVGVLFFQKSRPGGNRKQMAQVEEEVRDGCMGIDWAMIRCLACVCSTPQYVPVHGW